MNQPLGINKKIFCDTSTSYFLSSILYMIYDGNYMYLQWLVWIFAPGFISNGKYFQGRCHFRCIKFENKNIHSMSVFPPPHFYHVIMCARCEYLDVNSAFLVFWGTALSPKHSFRDTYWTKQGIFKFIFVEALLSFLYGYIYIYIYRNVSLMYLLVKYIYIYIYMRTQL